MTVDSLEKGGVWNPALLDSDEGVWNPASKKSFGFRIAGF